MTTETLLAPEPPDIPIAVESPSTAPPSPLLRGHLPDELARRAESVAIALTAAFEPRTDREKAAVAELALARSRQYELEAASDAINAVIRTTAAESAAREAHDRFVRDREAWLAEPALNVSILGSTRLGAEFLARLWADFAASLASDSPGPADDLTRLASAALGSPWQVDAVRGNGIWFWSRIVRIASDPGERMSAWIDESSPGDDTRSRARWICSIAPSAALARTELLEKAESERIRWSHTAETIERNEITALPTQALTGDAKTEKRRLQIMRELIAARNRADRLERRLDGLTSPRNRSRARDTENSRETPVQPVPDQPVVSEYPMETISPGIGIRPPDLPVRDQSDPAELSEAAVDLMMTEPEQVQAEAAAGPFDPPIVPEPVKTPEIPIDAQLRSLEDTEVHAACDTDELEPVEPILANLSGTRLKVTSKLSRYRMLDWADRRAVTLEDAGAIRNLANMPVSMERDAIVRLIFGSEKTFRRAWRRFSSWADRAEPAGSISGGSP